LGTPLSLRFGRRKVGRVRRGAPARAHAPSGADGLDWAVALLAALSVPPPVRNGSITFHADGAEARRAMLALIDNARQRVDVGTFVLADDEVGGAVRDALMRSARRGVQTRLLLDAIGGLRTPRRLIRELRRGGVAVRRIMPVIRNPVRGRTNRRNHRKLVAGDSGRPWRGRRNRDAGCRL